MSRTLQYKYELILKRHNRKSDIHKTYKKIKKTKRKRLSRVELGACEGGTAQPSHFFSISSQDIYTKVKEK